MKPIVGDLAGVAYWDRIWAAPAKHSFDPAALANRPLADLIRRFLAPTPTGGLILEAGCADSVITAFVESMGYQTAGLDYSLAGCENFRRKSPRSAVYHADVFAPPPRLLESSDAVFSLGLVEHFSDTTGAIEALAKLVKPGGYMLTVVPNMHGSVGFLQKLLNRTAYDVHVPLTPQDLCAAHVGAEVMETGYLGCVSYGVVNPGQSLVSRVIVAVLARLSLGAMALDRIFRLPRGRAFAPYCYCIARVRGA